MLFFSLFSGLIYFFFCLISLQFLKFPRLQQLTPLCSFLFLFYCVLFYLLSLSLTSFAFYSRLLFLCCFLRFAVPRASVLWLLPVFTLYLLCPNFLPISCSSHFLASVFFPPALVFPLFSFVALSSLVFFPSLFLIIRVQLPPLSFFRSFFSFSYLSFISYFFLLFLFLSFSFYPPIPFLLPPAIHHLCVLSVLLQLVFPPLLF